MATPRLYENATDKDIFIRELDIEIPAHDRVSVVADYHTPLNLANYPGVTEVTAMQAEEHQAALDTALQVHKDAGEPDQSRPAPTDEEADEPAPEQSNE